MLLRIEKEIVIADNRPLSPHLSSAPLSGSASHEWLQLNEQKSIGNGAFWPVTRLVVVQNGGILHTAEPALTCEPPQAMHA